MIIGNDGAAGSFENAMSRCERFGLTKDQALQEWKSVSSKVEGWKVFFTVANRIDSKHPHGQSERILAEMS
jgi:hypothetical protein